MRLNQLAPLSDAADDDRNAARNLVHFIDRVYAVVEQAQQKVGGARARRRGRSYNVLQARDNRGVDSLTSHASLPLLQPRTKKIDWLLRNLACDFVVRQNAGA